MSFLVSFLPSIYYVSKIFETRDLEPHCLSDAEKDHLEESQDFLDSHYIREDLKVVEDFNQRFCSASGTNLFGGTIHIAPEFLKIDSHAFHFILKHEISHIKYNDLITVPLVASISSVVATIFGSFVLSAGIGFSISSITAIWREGRADDFAIENSSIEELLGGRRFFIATQESSMENWMSHIMHPHPTLKSRIEKIERALLDKGFLFDKLEENEKILKLKAFVNAQTNAYDKILHLMKL